jgi:ATP synthase protein I
VRKRQRNLQEGGLLDAVAKASVLGLHLVSGMIIGGVMGYFLDKWLGTGPWLKLVFFALGLGAGARNLYLDAKLLLKTQERRDAAGSESRD